MAHYYLKLDKDEDMRIGIYGLKEIKQRMENKHITFNEKDTLVISLSNP